MNALSKNIKKFREAKGLTQEQVAAAVGKSKNVVSNWENGRHKPDAETIEILLGLFDVDANTLLGWESSAQLKQDASDSADRILATEKVKSLAPLLDKLSDDDMDLAKSFIERLVRQGGDK